MGQWSARTIEPVTLFQSWTAVVPYRFRYPAGTRFEKCHAPAAGRASSQSGSCATALKALADFTLSGIPRSVLDCGSPLPLSVPAGTRFKKYHAPAEGRALFQGGSSATALPDASRGTGRSVGHVLARVGDLSGEGAGGHGGGRGEEDLALLGPSGPGNSGWWR